MKGKRVFPKKFIFWIIGSGLFSSLAGFLVAHLWYNPSSRAWFDMDFWREWLRFGEILRISHTEYYDLNDSKFKNLTDAAISKMVSNLDSHSAYYTPKDYEAFQEDSNRQYFGIGIMIRKIERGVLVSKVFPDGPAEEAGLEVGDLIISVNDEKIDGLDLSEISSKIKGVAGSSVSMKFMRHELVQEIAVKRGQIQVSTVDKYFLDENQTGYLHLIQFGGRSGEEVAKALTKMKNNGMKNLILDLRDNTGGLLSSAIEVASFFLPQNRMVVELKGREVDESRTYRTEGTTPKIEVPMVILINESSASASEIVAGALSVLGRAKTLGERSYGKGSVQTIFKTSDQSGLRLTTAMYYLPDGSTIHERGIEPQYFVECSDENESKLRIQRNLSEDVIGKDNFEEMFGFEPVMDVQLSEAKRILLEMTRETKFKE